MKKFFAIIIAAIMSLSMLIVPARAASPYGIFAAESRKTAILTNCEDEENGEGEGIICILNLVIDIMTIGIGILGVIGITVVGIQYLTAGGSEEKVRKAKTRMFDIIIGLVAYVALYAILKWLLPSFGS